MNTAKLGQIAKINPRLPRELTSQASRTVHFVPMAELSEEGYVSPNGTRRLDEVIKGYTYFENGDVLVAKITPCMENGKAALVQGLEHQIAFGSTEFHVLRPKEEVDGKYLFYMIWNPVFRHQAEIKMTGSAGQKRVPTSFLEQFEIPLPELKEQKRIAAILDKADAIRRKRQEAFRELNQLRLAVFYELFREDIVTENMTARLCNVAEVVSGVAKGRKLNGNDIRDVPYLRVANVQSGYLNMSEIKTIPAKESEIEAYSLHDGDVVMTEGGDHDKLGRGALWNYDIPDCIHQNHVFRVRLNRNLVLPRFFVYYLQTGFAKAYFLRCAKKTTNLASINMTQLRALPVPKVTLEKQVNFEKSLSSIESLIEREALFATEADGLFNSLVQRAFKGEL